MESSSSAPGSWTSSTAWSPNYAVAIVLLTLLVMLITTPLTLKGTRSMIKMQLLQPELKQIQEKHKGGDRNEMNQELMAFYQENQLNPLGGCFPLLVQAPVFLLLFRLIQGLTSRGADGTFDPKYLDEGSRLYQYLDSQTEMISFGLDLSRVDHGRPRPVDHPRAPVPDPDPRHDRGPVPAAEAGVGPRAAQPRRCPSSRCCSR